MNSGQKLHHDGSATSRPEISREERLVERVHRARAAALRNAVGTFTQIARDLIAQTPVGPASDPNPEPARAEIDLMGVTPPPAFPKPAT